MMAAPVTQASSVRGLRQGGGIRSHRSAVRQPRALGTPLPTPIIRTRASPSAHRLAPSPLPGSGGLTLGSRSHGPGPVATRSTSAVADGGAPAAEPSQGSFLDTLRAITFYVVTMITAVPLFITMMLMFPFVWLFDKYKRTAEHTVNNIWAKLSTSIFYRVEIEGKENLPSNDVAAVYVANHASYLDIYTLFHLDRNFKFISKLSNFLIPLIGWSMFMTGHIPLVRNERRSQMDALMKCRDLLSKGCSLLFFPEGTRTSDGKIHEFKKGAFSVAAKMKAPVVPVTLIGTYDLMKNGGEGQLKAGTVRVVVHPMIDGSKDADTMMKEAYKSICSVLPDGRVA